MMQKRFAQGFPGYRVFKSHSPFNPAFPNIIYLVRDPRDVMISCYQYRLGLNEFHGTLSDFIRSEEQGINAWQSHVNAWMNLTSAATPFLLVKYEELLADSVAVLERIFSYFGHVIERDILLEAAKNSVFETMKKDEQSDRYGGRTQFKDFEFFNQGTAGRGKLHLGLDEMAFIDSVAGDTLQLLGYSR
jgi:hypothetical protein